MDQYFRRLTNWQPGFTKKEREMLMAGYETKQFTYNDQNMTVSWNGKTYGEVKYFTVRGESERYGAHLTWNSKQGWTKNGGMPYVEIIEKLFDLK